MVGSTEFDSLPAELIIDIFIHLPPLDILHCQQICSRLRDIIDASNSLKIIIDMYEQGYLLVHPVERPLIEIWDNFIKNHRYLIQGDPTGQRKMLATGTPLVFDGILVDIEGEGDNNHYNPHGAYSESCTIALYDAVNRKLKWHVHLDFTFDPLQNCAISKSNRLLAIVRGRPVNEGETIVQVHLYDLYHGTPHTDAHSPMLEFPRHASLSVSTTIYGSYVGVLTRNNLALIWNWKAGLLLHVLPDVESYAFVSENHLLTMPANDRGYYGVDPSTTGIHILTAVTISTGEKHLLELPLRRVVLNGGFNAESSSHQLIRTPVPGIFGSRGEYELDKSLDIIVFSVEAPLFSRDEFFDFTVIVSCRKLHGALTAFRKSNSASTSLPWKAWGPELTRWVPRQGHLWACERPTAGPILSYIVDDPQMGLQPATNRQYPTAGRRYVMDFNHRPILRKTRHTPQCNISTITAKWTFSLGTLSAADLECSLPFRTMSTFDTVEYSLYDGPCTDTWL